MFRKATKEDGPQILSLVGEVLSSYGLKTNTGEVDSDLLDIGKNYFDGNGWFEVYETDGKIIGSFGLYKISDDACELRKMYLHPDYQGRGIGREMMERAIRRAVALNYKSIILESNRKLDRAFRLYEHYGFREFEPEHLSERCDFAMKLQVAGMPGE